MAQVFQRTWKSGPRKIRKVAWGYTLQVAGKQARKFNAAWSKQDAERELAGAKLGLQPTVPPAGVTLGVMAAEYLATQQAKGKKTIRNDRSSSSRLLTFFGAGAPLDSITPQRIAQYERQRLTEPSARLGHPVTPATLNRDLAILRALLRLAAEWEYLTKVPRIRLAKEPEGRLRFLSEAEAVRLLTECRRAVTHPVASCRSPLLLAVVTVALNTGMRRGEILGLTWDRVDFARGVVLLEITKSGRRREVPMNRAVYDVLAPLARPEATGRVFGPGTGRRAFPSAVERAQLGDFRFHDLRHTFASWLVMRGRPLKEVQELLGHATITMTMRYAHLSPDRLRDAVASLEDFSPTSTHSPVPPPARLVSSRPH